MYDTLAVEDHIYSFQRHLKQPACLDALKTLVQQRRAVYRYLLPHLPVGVPQRLLRGHARELLERCVTEGAARGRDDDPLDRVAVLTPEALPDCGVLGVDRPQFS